MDFFTDEAPFCLDISEHMTALQLLTNNEFSIEKTEYTVSDVNTWMNYANDVIRKCNTTHPELKVSLVNTYAFILTCGLESFGLTIW